MKRPKRVLNLQTISQLPTIFHIHKGLGGKKEETVFELEDFSDKKETFKFRIVKNMIDSEGD